MEEVIEHARLEIARLRSLIQVYQGKNMDETFIVGKIKGIEMVIAFYEEWLRNEIGVEEE